MATNPSLLPENAGRITAPDASYPYGSCKDDTTGSAGDGTPIKKALLNDSYGFFQALLTKAGIVPSGTADTATVSQLRDAMEQIMVAHVANADFYTDSGVVNNYVLTPVVGNKAIKSLTDGTRIRFIPGTSNTWVTRVNVAGLGDRFLRTATGAALVGGEITEDVAVVAVYDASTDHFRIQDVDALTLGGLTASQFLRSDQNDILNGSLTVANDVILSANAVGGLFGKEIGGTTRQIARIDSSNFVELGSPTNGCQIVHSGALLSNSDEIYHEANFPIGAGDHNTYSLMHNNVAGVINPGDDVDGSDLRYTSAGNYLASPIPIGTWRCTAYCASGGASTATGHISSFVRIN